jgi:hypothetical protein
MDPDGQESQGSFEHLQSAVMKHGNSSEQYTVVYPSNQSFVQSGVMSPHLSPIMFSLPSSKARVRTIIFWGSMARTGAGVSFGSATGAAICIIGADEGIALGS